MRTYACAWSRTTSLFSNHRRSRKPHSVIRYRYTLVRQLSPLPFTLPPPVGALTKWPCSRLVWVRKGFVVTLQSASRGFVVAVFAMLYLPLGAGYVFFLTEKVKGVLISPPCDPNQHWPPVQGEERGDNEARGTKWCIYSLALATLDEALGYTPFEHCTTVNGTLFVCFIA